MHSLEILKTLLTSCTALSIKPSQPHLRYEEDFSTTQHKIIDFTQDDSVIAVTSSEDCIDKSLTVQQLPGTHRVVRLLKTSEL